MSGFAPVVLAGGKGVRLWPMSREAMPKPYVRALGEEDTLLQATLRRIARLGGSEPTLVVCSAAHDFIVGSQGRGVAANGIRMLLESEGRNTAAAICAAALLQKARGCGLPMLVMPADHQIGDGEHFASAVRSALDLALKGHLVTFAIRPTCPATGYGYIEIGAALDLARQQYAVAAFVEKPDAALAMTFVDGGRHGWNSGMFAFTPSAILDAFAVLAPDVLAACGEALSGVEPGDAMRLGRAAFARAPAISIDYAIMEKAQNVATVLADFGWSDVGDWQAVWSNAPHDQHGNVIVGNAHALESSGSLVHGDGPLLVAIGLRDMIAVATKDAVIVAPRARAQDLKLAVAQLESRNLSEAFSGRTVLKPWGSFERLHMGPGFEVKQLTVLPGASLSLQRHRHRAENWVCVAGEGVASREEERIQLTPGEGLFIPQGAVHRLENPGLEVLKVIETQTGSYIGEDDIERLEDVYGRA